jgi:alpha-L-fucosidase
VRPSPKARDFFFTAPEPTAEEETRMMARHREQLVELLTRYGRIDLVCLDMWLGARVWPQLRDTVKLIRGLQPDVMLRARGIGNYGDYYTPEGFVPGSRENTAMPWFVIYPLGRSFSYEPDPARHKGGAWIIRKLVDAVAKGGAFMVGIGPDANGRFHPTAVENLKEAGAWLRVNGRPSTPLAPGRRPVARGDETATAEQGRPSSTRSPWSGPASTWLSGECGRRPAPPSRCWA